MECKDEVQNVETKSRSASRWFWPSAGRARLANVPVAEFSSLCWRCMTTRPTVLFLPHTTTTTQDLSSLFIPPRPYIALHNSELHPVLAASAASICCMELRSGPGKPSHFSLSAQPVLPRYPPLPPTCPRLTSPMFPPTALRNSLHIRIRPLRT